MSRAEPEYNEPLLEPLTRREREILGLLAQGFSAPEIAQQLVIALSSVKWHIQHLYSKLGVNSKRDALNRATALGLLGPAPTAPGQPPPPTGAPSPAPPSPAELPPDEPPFKGLRHFDTSDAHLFFGREHLIAALVARLRQHPFLAVVGASGSGKSSVVRAGLIPALAQSEPLASGARPPAGSKDWPAFLITPTAHPLEALAVSLTRDSESVTATVSLLDDLSGEARSLRLAAQRVLAQEGGARLLLVVDQFEEVFTLCHEEAERKAFIDHLLSAVEADGPVVAAITLRADFYAHCMPYPGLRAVLEQHQAYIGPMDAHELRRAIEAPAAQEGWEWEPGLVDLILRDVGGGEEPGTLPLLSHALLETWKRRRGRTLAFAGYREANGVRGAIAHTAQSVYEQLPAEQQAITRRIFLRLTEPGEGTRDTRRRAALSEILAAGEPARPQRLANEAVLRTLASARLITLTASTAEVAHEAILQEWPALREWLNDSREGLRLHRRLTEAAQAWDRTDRDPGELFRGTRLAQTLEWAAGPGQPEELSSLEREFLDASREHVAGEQAERDLARQRELEAAQALAESQRQRAEAERARADEQARSGARLRQRNRIVTAVGLVALALAAAAGFFGVQSNRNALQAERQAAVSLSRQLTLQATILPETRRDLALLLSLEALRLADTVDARSALLTSIRTRARVPHVLEGHTASVRALAISPDGATMATAGDDNMIILWDVAERQAIGQPLAGHTQAVILLAFSPDGSLLASVGFDALVILWDTATRQPLGAPLALPVGYPNDVAFSPDGGILAVSVDDVILLWDLATRELISQLRDPETRYVDKHAFGPNQTLAALNLGLRSDIAVNITSWDLNTNQIVDRVTLSTDPKDLWGSAAAFSHFGRWVVTTSQDGAIRLWEVSRGEHLRSRLHGSTSVTSLALSLDDQLLASGEGDGRIRLWDIYTSQALGQPLEEHTRPVTAVAFTPDGRTLASAGEDSAVILWDLFPRQSLGPPLTGHSTWVNGVAYSPDGRLLASGSNDGVILLRDAATYQTDGQPIAGPRVLGGLAFSRDGALLAAGGEDGALGLWDTNTQQPVGAPMAGHTGDVTSVAFSPDGLTLASGALDQTIRLWDVATGQPLGQPLAGHTGGVTSLAFSPDGAVLASGSRDHSLILWDVATRVALGPPLTGHTNIVTSLAFSPDGLTLVSGGHDGTIRIWNASTRAPIGQPLVGHLGPVLSVAVSPDGSLLASSGVDKTVRLWDLAAHQPLGQPFHEHQAAVNSLAFSPGGATLASASSDSIVLMWDVSFASWQARACAAAGRNLTQAEWDQYITGQPYHATCAEWPAGE